jgi:peptidoglycan DL-endopeptidase CwlO
MFRPRALTRFAAAGLLVALVAGFVALPCSSQAKPSVSNPSIEAKRRQAEAAQTKLDDLSTSLEMRYEELAQIEAALAKTRAQIETTTAELESANVALQSSENLLGGRASSIYRNGPVDIVAVFVGAVDFQDFITRLDLMRRIGRNDAALVAGVKVAKGRVEAAQAALEARETEQIALRDQARRKKSEYESAFEQQKTYLAGLTASLKRLIEAERVRQEKLAAARAAAAAAALKAQAARNVVKDLPFDASKLGASHPEAVRIAKKYLGVPYVWGGTTPSGFDCSGLMQYSYAELGISIPRTSREQFRAGAYIPPSRVDLLEPGDMVFFGYHGDPDQIHHVGMYVGGGDFIHAPSSGDVVRIASLAARIESRGDYVGAMRP